MSLSRINTGLYELKVFNPYKPVFSNDEIITSVLILDKNFFNAKGTVKLCLKFNQLFDKITRQPNRK